MHNAFNGSAAAVNQVEHAAPPAALGRRAGTFRLPLELKQMGAEDTCRHRSGWHHVMQHLREYHDPDGILLDDFIERSFQHAYCRQEWNEPWVGIFHHPPDLPPWLDETAPLDSIMSTEAFRRSEPWLKGVVALSDYLGNWLNTRLGVPVLVLKHPTEIPEQSFSIEGFLSAERPSIVQVGWYARNARAIYQLDAPEPYRKIHLLQRRPWVLDAIDRLDLASPHRGRPKPGAVEVIDELSNEAYDELLSRSVVFNEYFTVSASNTVIEAIARGVPLLVNRHPAIEEYLGRDYPLFFDDIADASRFLRDAERIVAAAHCMEAMDRSWMSARRFAEEVTNFINSI